MEKRAQVGWSKRCKTAVRRAVRCGLETEELLRRQKEAELEVVEEADDFHLFVTSRDRIRTQHITADKEKRGDAEMIRTCADK